MTFWMVYTSHLPTLALVSLGASEALVGLQNGFLPAAQLLQLPVLRAVAFTSKRSILILGQSIALLAGVPLLFFGALRPLAGDAGLWIALASLGLVAVGLQAGNTVWFPMLRSYVEAQRTGRFFGTLRTGWHFALILYYLGAQRWLALHPGSFAPLFGIAWACALVRIAMISWLPERSEQTGERIRVREAMALLGQPDLLRYLSGVTSCAALRLTVIPFAIVMLRREVGFSEADLVLTTIAYFAGGFVSLYLWGRVVDRVGPVPVFIGSALGMSALLLSLLSVRDPGVGAVAFAAAFFFSFSALTAGFGVADTQVLFRLTPPESPTRTLVVAGVTQSALSCLAPLAAGFALEVALDGAGDAIAVYHVFFAIAALLQAATFLPLRSFR